MNKTLSTTLTILTVLALAAVIFFAGSMYQEERGLEGEAKNRIMEKRGETRHEDVFPGKA